LSLVDFPARAKLASRALCVRIAGVHLRIYTIEQALRSTPDWGQAVGEFG
jgi:hypothetical protein